MKNDWFDNLRNRMEDYEQSAPKDLWNEIEASIPVRKAASPFRWVWRAAAVAAALTVGAFATLKITEKRIPDADMLAQQEIQATEPSVAEQAQPVEDSKTAIQDAEEAVRQKETRAAKVPKKNNVVTIIPSEEKDNLALAEPTVSETEAEKPSEVTTPKQKEEDQQKDEDQEYIQDQKTAEFLRQAAMEDRRKEKEKRGISTRFSVGSGATQSSSSGVFNTALYDRGSSPFSVPNSDNLAFTRASTEVRQSEDIYNDVDHKRPVRMSVMVNLPIGKIFGIETGVTYTLLNSTFTTTSAGVRTEDSQKLQYIGIPLNLTADIYNGRYLSIYGVAGGAGEKCVSSKVTSNVYDENSQKLRSSKKDIDLDKIQWSVNAGAGLQFNVTNLVGIYAEPGVSYHFDDGSDVNTIYKSHPFDFQLTFGVRFSLNGR